MLQDTVAGLRITNMMTFNMPRFEFEAEIDLSETLAAMGMVTPFGSGADFTGISSNPLFLDYSSHKTTISVNEQGTETTGVTSVIMAIVGAMSDCGNEVTADRPFIFAIYKFRDKSCLISRTGDESNVIVAIFNLRVFTPAKP